MTRFQSYWGHELWVDEARVLAVEDAGCGSRGVCARLHLDNGTTIDLLDRAERVQAVIATVKAT